MNGAITPECTVRNLLVPTNRREFMCLYVLPPIFFSVALKYVNYVNYVPVGEVAHRQVPANRVYLIDDSWQVSKETRKMSLDKRIFPL